MRAAPEPACAVRSIAQRVCRVDICLVVLIVGIKVADSGKVHVNPVPEVSF
jgi:hypothetical protein